MVPANKKFLDKSMVEKKKLLHSAKKFLDVASHFATHAHMRATARAPIELPSYSLDFYFLPTRASYSKILRLAFNSRTKTTETD